jgi:unsaturated pyranuronate lyase
VSAKRAATWYRWDQLPREDVHDRLSRRLITGDQLMLAHVYLKKGCVVPKHSHMNEQLTYILEGALRFRVGDDGTEEIVVRAGEVLHLPGNVPHEAHALEDTLDVDVFYPPREDWLNEDRQLFAEVGAPRLSAPSRLITLALFHHDASNTSRTFAASASAENGLLMNEVLGARTPQHHVGQQEVDGTGVGTNPTISTRLGISPAINSRCAASLHTGSPACASGITPDGGRIALTKTCAWSYLCRRGLHMVLPVSKLRLLIVEDNPLLREGMTALLNQRSDLTVVASGDSSLDVQKARHINPDVVLVDFGLRNQHSLHVVETLKKASPTARVILMDLLPVQEDIVEFVKVGVSGFILKDATLDDFVHTIHAVAEGTTVLPAALAGTLFSQISQRAVRRGQAVAAVRMTRREREIIGLIAEGFSNKEIARRLHIATYTVKSHVHNILEKLALHTRLEIAAYAYRDKPSEKGSS